MVTKHTAVNEPESADEREQDCVADHSNDAATDMEGIPEGERSYLDVLQMRGLLQACLFVYGVSVFCADVVIVKPEPVSNEGKDEFKGPEFRNKGGSKVKDDSQRRRPGEALFPMKCVFCRVNFFCFVSCNLSFFFFLSFSSDECLEEIRCSRVNCTACGQQVNHFQRDSVYQHPILKVLLCKVNLTLLT